MDPGACRGEERRAELPHVDLKLRDELQVFRPLQEVVGRGVETKFFNYKNHKHFESKIGKKITTSKFRSVENIGVAPSSPA